jgi:hypothetical protein
MVELAQLSGGCACGAIRYASSVEPIAALNCHCRDCQRWSGAAYLSGFVVPTPALAITGEPRWHATNVDGGFIARRGFCATCGTHLFTESTRNHGSFRSVLAGTLDDPSWFKPAVDIFVESAQPWVLLDPAIPKFDTSPTVPS